MKPPNGMYQTEAMIYLHANRLYHVLPSGTSGNLRKRAESGLKKNLSGKNGLKKSTDFCIYG